VADKWVGRPPAGSRPSKARLEELAKGAHVDRRKVTGAGTTQAILVSGQPYRDISRGGQPIDGAPAPQAEGVRQLERQREVRLRHSVDHPDGRLLGGLNPASLPAHPSQ
jgi:hypothetical protein